MIRTGYLSKVITVLFQRMIQFIIHILFASTMWMHAKLLQLCLTLCNLMDWSLPGFSVHGILQARILEWVAISFSKGSSWPRDWTHISCTGRWILYPWTSWEALSLTCHRHISHPSSQLQGHLYPFPGFHLPPLLGQRRGMGFKWNNLKNNPQ